METMLLAGRTAIVTGAGQGIGRSTALALAAHGASVVVNDLGCDLDGRGEDASLADGVVAEITASGGTAVASHDSVAEWDAAARIVALAVRCFGGVDVLVNNAGPSVSARLWELEPEDFGRVIGAHLTGTYNCTRHAVTHMMPRGWGRIVNLVSRAGLVGMPGATAYGAAKGGIFGFTNAASHDLRPHGITVNAVNPASTATRMVTGAIDRLRARGGDAQDRAEQLEAALQPPEAVAVVIAALCSEAAAEITGRTFLVSGDTVGVFEPLGVGPSVTSQDGWHADALAAALAALRLGAAPSFY